MYHNTIHDCHICGYPVIVIHKLETGFENVHFLLWYTLIVLYVIGSVVVTILM